MVFIYLAFFGSLISAAFQLYYHNTYGAVGWCCASILFLREPIYMVACNFWQNQSREWQKLSQRRQEEVDHWRQSADELVETVARSVRGKAMPHGSPRKTPRAS